MEVEAVSSLTQFGIAGLVGCMWIVERRAASVRERLVQALRDNTRALTALEVGQRGIAEALRGLGGPVRVDGGAPPFGRAGGGSPVAYDTADCPGGARGSAPDDAVG